MSRFIINLLMKDNDKHSNKQEFVLRLKLDLFFSFWSDFSAEKKDNFSENIFAIIYYYPSLALCSR